MQAREKVGRCRVRIDLESALQLFIRTLQVPVEDTLCFAQVAMRLSIVLVQRDRFQGRFLRRWVSVEWFYVDVSEKIPDLRDPSPGTGECWIFLDCALKEAERPSQIFFASLV